MILRELIARLSLDLDKSQFDAADKKISGLQRGLEFAGKAAIALSSAMAVGIGFAVSAAADANETLNLMGLVFEQNQSDVMKWADTIAQAAGRSKFTLREMVTRIGAFLKPMVGDLDHATDLAKQLSERAIDFASAMNIKSDTEALEKFQAGLAGETEPLRRFGINMTVAALQAFALEQGIRKNVSAMSDAEKTQLRFDFIMARTADYAGDAANTSAAYANALKGLKARATDLVTTLGMKFIPAAEGVLRSIGSILNVLNDWVEHSNIVQAALITFGTIATAIAIRTAAAWAVANWPIVLAGLALAALVLIVDDFLTFLNGGDSVIGSFIDSIWGPGSAAEAAQKFRVALDDLSYFWTDIFLPAAKEAGQGAILFFGDMFTAIGDWAIANQATLMEWHDVVVSVIDAVVKAIADLIKAVGRLFGLDLGAWWRDMKKSWGEAWGRPDVPRQAHRGMGGPVVSEASHPAVAAAMSADPSIAANMSVQAPQASIATPPALMSTMNESHRAGDTINQSVSVTVPPDTPRRMARDVATTASDELRRMHRHARAATTQRAAEGS